MLTAIILIIVVAVLLAVQMGEVSSIVHAEDIDLTGGAATIAAAARQPNVTLPDADTIKLPDIDGLEVRKIAHCDETAGGLGALIEYLSKGSERKFRIGKNVLAGDLLVNEYHFAPGEFPLTKGQRIKAYGGISGAGAEQHAVVQDIYFPNLEGVSQYQGQVKHYHMLGVMTGTLIAATISGLNSILGDETALADSEIQFPTDPEKRYVLKGFWPTPGVAGTGVLGMMHPNGNVMRVTPAVFASAVRAPFIELNWEFAGDSPPRAIGAGAVTTSTELTMLLGEIN